MSKSATEGQETFTVVTEVKEAADPYNPSSSDRDTERQKRVLKVKTPWIGISALIAVIVLAIGQYLVLIFANKQSSSQWPATVSPNVCLSMLNNVSTLFLTFSIGNGIAIAWWRKAMGETSIAKLQKSWSFSTSSLSILRGISHFNVIALSALMAKVAVIDGVLFQRAIGTETHISWIPASKNVSASTRTAFPVTGSIAAGKSTTAAQTDFEYSYTVMNWLSTGDGVNILDYYVDGCEGVGCVYGLKGIGFAVDCKDTNETDNFVNAVKASGSGNRTIFSADWGWRFSDDASSGNYSSLLLNLTKPAIDDDLVCPTIFTVRQCELRPAIVNYTVAYTNFSSVPKGKPPGSSASGSSDNPTSQQVGSSGSQLSYSCMSPEGAWTAPSEETEDCLSYSAARKQIVGVDVIKELTLDERRWTANDSKLAGIFNTLRDQFTAKAELFYDAGTWSVAQSGALAPIAEGMTPLDPSFCNYTYYDQTSMILKRLNTLMLQTSVDYSLSPTDDYEALNVHADQFYKDIYYTIDFRFCYVAIGLTVLVVACVLPTYWQFWVLGREVTLGPLEIANAFRVPIFVEEQVGHHDFEKIIKAVGHKKLRYHHAAQPGQQPGFHVVS